MAELNGCSFSTASRSSPRPEQTRILNKFQYYMAVDLLNRFQAVRYASNDEEIQVGDLPERARLAENYVRCARMPRGSGKWLLQIYPEGTHLG